MGLFESVCGQIGVMTKALVGAKIGPPAAHRP